MQPESLICSSSWEEDISIFNKYQDKYSMNSISSIGVQRTHSYRLLRSPELVDMVALTALYVSCKLSSTQRNLMSTVHAQSDANIGRGIVIAPMTCIVALFP
jgi:hypothetical protein